MSVQLLPGIRWNIQIKSEDGSVLYQKPCSSREELKNFMHQYNKNKEGWSLIEGIAIPLRTHNFKDFAKDFFLPTFFNGCLKINSTALRVFSSIFAIALDVFTLPLRLLTSPFRIFYNYQYPEAELPISSLIKQSKHYSNALKSNLVKLCYEVEQVNIIPHISLEKDEEGNPFECAIREVITGGVDICLRKVPGGIKKKSFEETKTESYVGSGGKWAFSVGGHSSSSDTSYIL